MRVVAQFIRSFALAATALAAGCAAPPVDVPTYPPVPANGWDGACPPDARVSCSYIRP